jgi:hypothetical protein
MRRWGTAVLIVSVVLFAVERYVVFSALVPLASAGSHSAGEVLGFLYGNPPYSIFNVLLGFEIPAEGLFFLLQPHNVLLGISQAIHYGINLAPVYGFFWIIEKLRTSAQSRPGPWIGGCLGILIVVAGLVLAGASCVNSNAASSAPNPTAIPSPVEQLSRYTSATTGLHFEYPSFMTIREDTQKDRGASGELITTTKVSATSRDPVMVLLIQVIEDPQRNQMFPDFASDESLRTQVGIDIAMNLNYPNTDANRSAVISAGNRALVTTISGYKAVTYDAALAGTPLGHIRMRGALVVTDTRDVTIYLIGSDESSAPGSVSPEYVDAAWSKVVASLEIDF